jgi:uracil-DNA glycosylase family 4
MDQFSHVLGHAHATLLDMQQSPGPKPKAQRRALHRLQNAASIQAVKPAIVPATPEPVLENPASVQSIAHTGIDPDTVDRSRDWTWEELESATRACTRCPHLVRSRTQVVFGVGNRNADLMFVGEAPGADEDLQGEPFVGRAGQLLTKIIEAMGLTRDDIYIGNVLKCRPDMPPGESGNRKPRPDEMATCLPWLSAQIRLVRPRAIVALGATAAEGLLGETALMRDLRGKWFEHESIPALVTYHPAYLLRNQSLTEKRKVWEDMLLVMEKMNLPISEKQRGFFLKAAS